MAGPLIPGGKEGEIMEQEDVRRKIKSLLALAESDNESEALAALKAARKLMLKYHLSGLWAEQGNTEPSRESARRVVVHSLGFKKTKMEIYHLMAASTLSKNFRCMTYHKGNIIFFMGFEEDADAVLSLMEYVIRFMPRDFRAYATKDYGTRPAEYEDPRTKREIENSWKVGFQLGIRQAFEEQDREHREYELMCEPPAEVRQAYEKRNIVKRPAESLGCRKPVDERAFDAGTRKGRQAMENRRLKGKGEASE